MYEPSVQANLFGEAPEEHTADWQAIDVYIRKRLEEVFAGGVLEPRVLHSHTGAPLFAYYFALANCQQDVHCNRLSGLRQRFWRGRLAFGFVTCYRSLFALQMRLEPEPNVRHLQLQPPLL